MRDPGGRPKAHPWFTAKSSSLDQSHSRGPSDAWAISKCFCDEALKFWGMFDTEGSESLTAKESPEGLLWPWTSYVYDGDSRYLKVKMKTKKSVCFQRSILVLIASSVKGLSLNSEVNLGFPLVPQFCEGTDVPTWKFISSCKHH